MNAIKRFFRTVLDSASKPQSYNQRLREPSSRALGYLYWLLVCSMAVTTLWLAIGYIAARPDIQTFITETQSQIPDFYPAELVLTLSGGTLSTNAEEPYVFDPAFWTSDLVGDFAEEGEEMPTHFITIDTQGSIEAYEEYDTLVLLTADKAMFPDEDGGMRVMPWTDVQNPEKKESLDSPFIVNKELYDEGAKAFMPFVKAAPFVIDIAVLCIMLLLPLIGAGFLWLWMLLYLAVFTLPVWALSGLMGRRLSYGKIWQISLFGLTLPLLVTLVQQMIPNFSVPFLFSLIFLVWMGVVLSKLPRAGARPIPAVPYLKPEGTKRTLIATRKR